MPAATQRCRWSQHPARAGEIPTIEHWIGYLEGNSGIDEKGIDDMHRLATEYGMEGYKEANMIIGKLLEMQNDDRSLYRPSNFVANSVNNAEYFINIRGTTDVDIVTV